MEHLSTEELEHENAALREENRKLTIAFEFVHDLERKLNDYEDYFKRVMAEDKPCQNCGGSGQLHYKNEFNGLIHVEECDCQKPPKCKECGAQIGRDKCIHQPLPTVKWEKETGE